MEVVDVRSLLSRWSQRLAQADIDFIEDINPENDPNDDEICIYHASFQPHSLKKADFSIDVLTYGTGNADCYVSAHIGTYQRMAQRCGKWTEKPKSVIGAWSPRNTEALEALLNTVAEGKAFVMTRSIGPWLYAAEALLPQSIYESFPELLSPYCGCKRTIEPFLQKRPWLSRIDRFESWTAPLT